MGRSQPRLGAWDSLWMRRLSSRLSQSRPASLTGRWMASSSSISRGQRRLLWQELLDRPPGLLFWMELPEAAKEFPSQVEIQGAMIADISKLCDAVVAWCDAQEERLKKPFMDLPIWDL
ncbi:unnamed protein product [Cuscuta europaea]|uniref:Uncharacterized protein n=1 Tax=Cuscuta europaea TaxID=41803 RepID=A0A9P0YUI3_CUSEU|nr:unnamed protein product [Cuscuta europaea]